MARRKVTGRCCICGEEGPLTYEHVPPRAAYNDETIFEADLRSVLRSTSQLEMRSAPTRQNQRGAGRYSLCKRCNSNTGALYGPAYVEWARQARRQVDRNVDPERCSFDVEPLAVIKEIVAMFASACGPEFFAGSPALQQFVLAPDQRGLPDDVRLYAYLVSPNSTASRQSGVTASMRLGPPMQTHVYAEISFPPIGYVAVLSDTPPPDSRLVDISFMADADLGQRRILSLPFPVLEVHSVIPADFRSLDEIDEAFRRNRSD